MPPPSEVVPFIRVCSDGSYEVCDEAVEFLRSLTGPLGVIAMVGPYRTGKSTLLNRCILKEQVFTVGATVQACTKGILLVKKVLEGPVLENGKRLSVIVIDTEGLGSVDATSTHDTRIFSMALLLSSLFIYNSVGSIDENALSTLSLVTNICKFLKLDGSDGSAAESPGESSGDSLSQEDLLQVAENLGREAFPPLLWLVRDFTLQLVDGKGDPINPAQYLEQSLQSLSGVTGSKVSSGVAGNIQEKNNVRACIRNCFPLRHCITMVRPVNDESQLQMLSRGIDTPVRKLFEDQMEYVRNFVFANIRVKKVLDIPTTGKGLITYAHAVVRSINEGTHPVIRDAWTLITESQCRDAMDTAKQKYFDCLNLQMNWDDACKQAIRCFKEQPMPTGKMQSQYSAELKAFLENDRDRIRKQESQLAESQICTKLSDLDHFILQSPDCTDVERLRRLQTELDNSLKVLLSGQNLEISKDVSRSAEPSIDTLRSTLNRLHARCNGWTSHLCAQVARWKHQSGVVEAELRENIRQFEELELAASAANDHEQEQQKYHEMRQKLTDENETILRRAAQAEAHAESLETEVSELQSQKAAMELKIDELERAAKKLDDEMQRYTSERETLSLQHGETVESAVREASHAERQRYLSQLQDVKKDLDGRVAAMTSEYETKTTELSQKLSSLQNSVLQQEAVRKQLLETVGELRTELRKLQEDRLAEQIDWCKKVGDAEKSVATLSGQKRRLEEQLDPALPKRLKTLESECASLKSELQFKTHEITRLEKGYADAKASATKWQDQYHTERCKHVEELMRVTCSRGGSDKIF